MVDRLCGTGGGVTATAPDLVTSRTGGRVLRGFAELAAAVADTADDSPWLAELRRAAVARFVEVGLPGSKDEEWRFTPLQALAAVQFGAPGASSAVAAADLEPLLVGGPGWPLLVVVDGAVDRRLSRVAALPSGVTFVSLADAIAAGHPLVEQHLAHHAGIDSSVFNAISAALIRDGTLIHVGAGVTLSLPLHVVYLTTKGAAGSIIVPRSLVVLDHDARATVIETFATLEAPSDGRRTGRRSDAELPVTRDPYLTAACAEIVLGENARLEHIRLQEEALTAFHVGCTVVDQARDSHFRSFALARGARLSRHDLRARLGGSNVEALLYGLYLARGEQLIDNHTAIFHDRPDCRSWEVYKGVLAERARGVFNGKVIVRPEAQRTDAKQTNRNLLLGDEARINTKPQLEIFADDVKCTHGATVGKLDEQQRYYLRTRGIAGRAAEVLLITAFIAEVLAEIVQPQVRNALTASMYAEMDALIA
ncbi:MAG: Fe-S cluster assembly protein SufD [Gemmatimonadales bacterium]